MYLRQEQLNSVLHVLLTCGYPGAPTMCGLRSMSARLRVDEENVTLWKWKRSTVQAASFGPGWQFNSSSKQGWKCQDTWSWKTQFSRSWEP